MTEWTETGRIFTNSDGIYTDFLQATGASEVTHYGIVRFGDPRAESFLKEITIYKHYYSTGDRLSKIAYKHYGDAKYWWVLAWFNGKPTDFHCKIGDVIYIPSPLEEAILQAQNKVIF